MHPDDPPTYTYVVDEAGRIRALEDAVSHPCFDEHGDLKLSYEARGWTLLEGLYAAEGRDRDFAVYCDFRRAKQAGQGGSFPDRLLPAEVLRRRSASKTTWAPPADDAPAPVPPPKPSTPKPEARAPKSAELLEEIDEDRRQLARQALEAGLPLTFEGGGDLPLPR